MPTVHDLQSPQIDSNSPDYIQYSQLEFTKLLGSGAAGQVYKGLFKDKDAAIKVFETKFDEFEHEFRIISSVRAPNIVAFYGLYISSETQLYMITELLSLGNCHNLVQVEKVSLHDLIAIARDVVAGVHFLHSSNVVHADIALRNVLVSLRSDGEAKYTAKVNDFGLSRSLYGSFLHF